MIAGEIQLESPDFGMDEALKISFEMDVKMLFGFGKREVGYKPNFFSSLPASEKTSERTHKEHLCNGVQLYACIFSDTVTLWPASEAYTLHRLNAEIPCWAPRSGGDVLTVFTKLSYLCSPFRFPPVTRTIKTSRINPIDANGRPTECRGGVVSRLGCTRHITKIKDSEINGGAREEKKKVINGGTERQIK